MTLSVHLGDIDPVSDYVWGADPPTLSLVPKFWSKERRGGYRAAEIQVMGAQTHLWDVLTWLRRPVEIIGEFGQEVWAGFVNEVQITTGSGVEFSISMDGMANRIAVAYASRAPDGGTERGTTDWVEDAPSIRRYGVKEYLHILGEGEQSDAELALTKLMATMPKPRANRTLQGSGKAEARLLCLGWADTLRWRRWQRTGTRIEFEGLEPAEDQAIGWGLTATTIAITKGGGSGIHDISGRMGAVRIGNKITVSGSSGGNNNTYTVVDFSDDDPEVYTASTVYFEGDNDIKDTAGGLGVLRKGAVILISGSASNSEAHKVSTAGDDAMEVDTTYGGVIVGEAVGPSITIQQGNEALIYPRPAANEQPGASITLTLQGYRTAQSFTVSSASRVGQIAIQIGVTGSPLDSARVAIYSDSSGSPGSSLGSAEVDEADLPGDANWVWFRFPGSGVSLSAGTYWIVVERTGSVSGSHYYKLAMTTTGSGGTCKVYTGSSWATNPTNAHMPYKVWFVEETTAIVQSIIDTIDDCILAARVSDVSGVWVNPEEDGDRSAYDVIEKVLELGTSAGARYFWEVTGDRVLRVYQEPTYDFNPIILSADGSLRFQGGTLLARGELPTARYLIIEDVPEHLGLWPIPLDGAEYDAEENKVQLYPKEEGNVTV